MPLRFLPHFTFAHAHLCTEGRKDGDIGGVCGDWWRRRRREGRERKDGKGEGRCVEVDRTHAMV